jgi:hypothetical protein
MALATPAANPKPDTPNTSSWISSTSVEQCSTLDFEAHGFPKGQTLNIALDDDQEADKQPIDDTGSASGTIEIPCDFPTGTHRLHFTSTDDYTSYSPNFEVTAKPAATSEAANKPSATPSRDSAHLASGTGRTNSNTESNAGSNAGNRGASQNRSGTAKNTTETAAHNKVKATGFTAQPTTVPNNGGLFDKNADEAIPTAISAAGSIPYIGFFVGGAILLVGMTAINAWLYVQRNDPRRDRYRDRRDRDWDRWDRDRERRDRWDDEPLD